jgi:hypothetical protein
VFNVNDTDRYQLQVLQQHLLRHRLVEVKKKKVMPFSRLFMPLLIPSLIMGDHPNCAHRQIGDAQSPPVRE